ncbi:MAG: phage tail tape measure protein [Methanocorpusculum sp.]|nr:phage tail tape measure protein [Methanocorpusculum sp.]MDE2521838.1 phage tail tape measure protein [Methanocorpusculum sp.]MDE2524831.1 phage tail tape measure protein [Methanocorpusculum sp.]
MAASMQDIGSAVADLNTAYGLQGEELEELSRQYLALSQVTGMNVSTAIEKARAVFNKFGISVDQQTDKLDYFFRVYQNSGVSVDRLLSILDQYDRGFQLLGLSVEEAAAMIGTAVQKDGVEAAQELAQGLEMAAGRAVDKWGSESEAQAGLRETIRLMQEAGDETAAMGAGNAAELFGTRYVGKVAGAITGGVMDYSALMQTASTGVTLQALAKTTETLEQKMQKLGASTQEALLPIGNVLQDAIGGAIDSALPALEMLGNGIQKIVDLFGAIWEKSPLGIIQQIWDRIANSQRIQDAIQRLIQVFDRLWSRIFAGGNSLDLIDKLIDVLAFTIENVLVPAIDALSLVIAVLTGDWESAAGLWKQYTESATESITNLFGGLFDGLDQMLFGWIGTTIGAWKSWITGIVSTMTNGIAGMIDMWDGWLDGMLDTLESWGQSIVNFFVDIWNNLVKTVQDAANSMIQNTPLGSLLNAFGVDASINLTDWQIEAPKVEIARSDVLKDAASGVRGVGATINQTVNITTTKVVDALEAQRGIERANRDLVRSGV